MRNHNYYSLLAAGFTHISRLKKNSEWSKWRKIKKKTFPKMGVVIKATTLGDGFDPTHEGPTP